jgi:hypothetical protein
MDAAVDRLVLAWRAAPGGAGHGEAAEPIAVA